MNKSVEAAVLIVRKEMDSSPAPGTLRHNYVLCEGQIVAEKFFYGGGYAVWVVGSGTLSFYDEGGRLLRSLRLESAKSVAA